MVGHDGLIAVDESGRVEYSDFGPVGGPKPLGEGEVRVFQLDTRITFGTDGLPTGDSFAKLSVELANKKSQDPSTVRINYFKTTQAETEALKSWIADMLTRYYRGLAPYYQVNQQNCAVFCVAGLTQAGVIQNNNISIVPNVLWWDLLSGVSTVDWDESTQTASPSDEVSSTILDWEYCTGTCSEGP